MERNSMTTTTTTTKTTTTTAPLAGRSVAVAVYGRGIGERLAGALAVRGAQVALLAEPPSAVPAGGVTPHAADFSSAAAMRRTFEAVAASQGPIDIIVHAALPDASLTSGALAEQSDEQWQAACGAALDASFHCLQGLHASLAATAGLLVQIGPSLAQCGANGLVALSAASEAQRGLLKSAARQWGRDGIRAVWIAVAAGEISAVLTQADLPVRSEAIALPLGRVPQLDEDVVDMIMALGGAAGRFTTGLSLTLDGGEWMLP
ncbi:MAG: SDR family NAD(P)-dependent oxidoreductase [Steroidobacteraceae bacterium]